MIPELAVVRYFLSSANYVKYSRFVAVPKELREVRTLHHCLESLHKQYPDTDKTIDELEAMVYASYPNMRQPEREAYAGLFVQLREVEVRDEILQSILSECATRAKA